METVCFDTVSEPVESRLAGILLSAPLLDCFFNGAKTGAGTSSTLTLFGGACNAPLEAFLSGLALGCCCAANACVTPLERFDIDGDRDGDGSGDGMVLVEDAAAAEVISTFLSRSSGAERAAGMR